MKRWRDRLFISYLLIALGGLWVLSTAGCYTEQPANGKVDMNPVPQHIAIVIPIEGLVLDFGAKTVGTSNDLVLHLTNSGPTPATTLQDDSTQPLPSPFTLKDGTFPGTGGNCTSTLAPAPDSCKDITTFDPTVCTCTLVFTYSPTSDGSFTGTFHFTYINGIVKIPMVVNLQGVTSANVSISNTPTYDYSVHALNTTTFATFTLTNTGITPATLLQGSQSVPLVAPFSFAGGTYPGTGGTCTDTLLPNATCTVVVAYKPTTAGSVSKTLALSFNDGNTLTSVSTSLTGQTPATLAISASGSSTYDFGKRGKGSTSPVTLTLTNSGATQATLIRELAASALTSPFSFTGGSYPGTGGTCTYTLAAGSSCTMTVSFSPVLASNRSYSATAKLEYNDGTGAGARNQQTSLTITGYGQFGWNAGLDAPMVGRFLHTAVWTGSAAIFWGGQQDTSTRFNGGSIYDPVVDQWSTITAVNAPLERSRHTAVWASTLSTPKMLIWGGLGVGDSPLSSGAIYDPVANTWTSTSTVGAPSARYGHTAIWDPIHNKMIIWGGGNTSQVIASGSGIGYIFDPTAGVTGSWTKITDTLANTPSARYFHSAVMAGSKMVIWGGCSAKNVATTSCQVGQETNSGAIYDTTNGTWTTITLASAPAARAQHTAIWAGTQMIVWGGETDPDGTGANDVALATGGIYTAPTTPGSDTWSATSAVAAPIARFGQLAFWTGSIMQIWGGLLNSGAGSLLSAPNNWSAMTSTSATPTATFGAAGVFTGASDLRTIVFGGYGPGPNYSSSIAVYSHE